MTTTLTRLTTLALALSAALLTAAADAPKTMTAVRMQSFGGPEVLKVEQIPVPAPGEGEVLVRVHAAGVNPVDWKVREGMLKGYSPQPPATPGYDVAGVVEAIGTGVEGVKTGDEVFAYLSIQRGGGYAQFAIVKAGEAAIEPKALDFNHAAATPLAALTAWQALIDTAKIQAGQTVLVHGGSGGVGHFAVQIAKAKGAKVIATASGANQEFLKALGADQIINYRTQKFEELCKDVDVVLDTVGGDTLAHSYQVVKPGGIIVSIVGPPDAAKLKERGIRGTAIMVRPNGKQLAEIAQLIAAGKITPTVGETFKLEEAAKAQEKSKAGGTRGKIVLVVE